MDEKIFQGTNVQEVLRRIKAELGSDAVIHNTRWIKQSGILGVFGAEIVEVVASDGKTELPRKEQTKQSGRGLVGRRYKETLDCLDSRDTRTPKQNLPAVESEPKRLRSTVDDLRVERENCAVALAKCLTRQGFPEVSARRFADAAVQGTPASDNGSLARLKSYLITLLRGMIRTQPGLEPGKRGPKYYALVGPTGTGKTTTVAKLAAISSAKKGLKVGIVSIDNYRVGGTEQIRRYAEIIGVPLFHVADVNDAIPARTAMMDRDIVLVDTTGRSPADTVAVSDMALLLREINPDEVFLTVEAGIVGERAERIRMSFGHYFKISRVIATKIDELPFIGAAVSLSIALTAPIAYLTNGQQVPDDIRSAGKESVIQLLKAALGD
jgi:flagellar biosynthesis protein FlhF